jgi:PAS domain S-box-containing protein
MGERPRSNAQELAAELEEARRRIEVLEAGGGKSLCDGLVKDLLDGFSLLSPEGVHLEVNDALCAMTGFSRDELLGAGPPHPYWPPEEYAAIEAAFAQTLSGKAETFALTFMRKDGERFPVLVTPSVMRDAGGAMVSAFATVKDMTAQRRAEAALAESEQLFRLTFDQAPIGAALVGLDFRFRRVNARFAQLTGYSEDELLERGFPDITHPDDVAADVVEVKRLAAGAIDEYKREKRYVRKDGSTAWGDASVRPVSGASGETMAFVALVNDITERRIAEQALRENEERLRTVLLAAREGIVLQAPDGRVLVWNEAAEQVFGVSESEIVGKSALGRDWGALHEDGSPWPASEHPSMKSFATGEPQVDVVMGVQRGGELRWINVNAEPIFHPGEAEPYAVVVSFADISARKRAQDDLRKSEARYRLLLENMNDAVYVHELKAEGPGGLVDVNDRACEVLGYSREELLGMEIGAIDVPEQVERLPAIMASLHQSGRAVFQTEHLTKDDRRVPVEVSVRVLDIEGRATVLSVARDISERVRAERDLSEVRRLLDETQAISRLGGWEYDVAHARVHWTDEVYRIHGVDAEFDPNSVESDIEFYAPWSAPLIAEAFRQAVEAGTPYDLELEFDRADGRRIWVRTMGLPLVEDGKVVRVTGNIMDITERKQAAEEIHRLNVRLEERVISRTAQRDAFNRELESFAYSAAHDLRAPLRAIDGFSKILLEDAAERLTPPEMQHLERVRAAAQRMAQMIDDLMGLSKATRRPLLRRTVDVSATAREVAEELLAAQPDRRVELVIAPGMTAVADPALLRLILVQLLDNAWKFTGKHDQARIEVGAAQGDGSGGGDSDEGAIYFVRDDGAGFDMRCAEHLFGAFQRFHAAGEFAGDGIGLATVQRLVNRHGGRVWAEAEVEKGATVYFTLPDVGDGA